MNFAADTLPPSRLTWLPKICVAVTAQTADLLASKASNLLREFAFVELRLDSPEDPADGLRVVQDLLAQHPAATLLATCRRKVAGGHFDGDAQAELNLLLAAAQAGCQLVDLAIESAEQLPFTAVADLRAAGAIVILSYHDFHGTGDLHAIAERMRAFSPDILKIVPTARSLSDNLIILSYLATGSTGGHTLTVGMAMGEQGFPSRLLNLRAGSAFTFAAATPDEATAPGQIDARTLADRYRVDRIGPDTLVFGVAGDPVRSSLSPLIHNMAFQREGIDAVYLPLRAESAEDLFTLARALPLQGLSVTMPLKQAVMPFLDSIDPLAARIRAVNTIARRADGSFHGFNTDVAGILTPLERRVRLEGARVLVLGAGGAARAAVFACASRGANVSILNRTTATAEQLARESGAHPIDRDQVSRAGFEVMINATPAGMKTSAATLPLEASDITAPLVFDLVYNPLDTPLLQIARERGLATIPGTEMFVLQGARQFEIWTGRPAPEQEMRSLVLESLTLRG